MKHAHLLIPTVWILIVALLLASVWAIAGGRAFVREEGPPPVEYLIGMSQANLVEPWRIQMNRDIERAAAKNDNMRVIFTNATQDYTQSTLASSERQIGDIQKLLGYGIDLLVISPADSESLRPVISEVYKTIPVIVLDRDVTGDEYTLYIGPNNYMIGNLAGQVVTNMLGDAGGNVVQIVGAVGSPPVESRSKGFLDAIKAQPNVKILETLDANWMQDQAEDKMKEFLVRRTADVDVVFAHSDAMAYGAYIAADKFRVPGMRFVGVDGLDGPNGGANMVLDGILEATFYCPTGGEQAIEYALRILRGDEALPHRLILNPKEIQ